MYKIFGADGKEYGPVSLEQLRQWVAQGRVNAQTRVQQAGAGEWKPAAELPELGFATAAGTAGAGSPPAVAGQAVAQQKGLAVTSFVLGLLSMLCFGVLTGIPAIICGHIAHTRARKSPGQYGGAGLAIAGFALGYVSVILSLVVLGLLLPALAKTKRGLQGAKERAQSISCMNNMKQIGLAARTWAIDNDDNFPFNVSTSKGGTRELCQRGSDGFDRNAVFHFQVMSNELSTPRILVCPADTKRHPALNFLSLRPENVSYQMRSGTNLSDANPQEVLAVCPIHNHVLFCDGSVQTRRKGR